MTKTLLRRFLDWCAEPLNANAPLASDPPITGGGHSGPTGNWYIVHQHSPTGSTTCLSGHWTRAGAEREVALCKKHLPWGGEGEWIVKPTSEYGRTP